MLLFLTELELSYILYEHRLTTIFQHYLNWYFFAYHINKILLKKGSKHHKNIKILAIVIETGTKRKCLRGRVKISILQRIYDRRIIEWSIE